MQTPQILHETQVLIPKFYAHCLGGKLLGVVCHVFPVVSALVSVISLTATNLNSNASGDIYIYTGVGIIPPCRWHILIEFIVWRI